MDTTETYIKMCEKAEEIQGLAPKALWEGNRSFQLSGNNVYAKSPTSKRFIWLPRQDQLQEMAWAYYEEIEHDLYTLYSFFEDFIRFYYRPSEFPCEVFRSFEQLWLAFVMKKKYNKIWNGEEWAQ